MDSLDLHGKKVAEAEKIFFDYLDKARLSKKLIEVNFITGTGLIQNRFLALSKEHDLNAYVPMHNRGCIVIEFE